MSGNNLKTRSRFSERFFAKLHDKLKLVNKFPTLNGKYKGKRLKQNSAIRRLRLSAMPLLRLLSVPLARHYNFQWLLLNGGIRGQILSSRQDQLIRFNKTLQMGL